MSFDYKLVNKYLDDAREGVPYPYHCSYDASDEVVILKHHVGGLEATPDLGLNLEVVLFHAHRLLESLEGRKLWICLTNLS